MHFNFSEGVSSKSEKDVLTLADLNDCLLESNDIVVSKTKKGIVLLRLKKDTNDQELSPQIEQHQQVMTLKKDDKGGVMFKECGKHKDFHFRYDLVMGLFLSRS